MSPQGHSAVAKMGPALPASPDPRTWDGGQVPCARGHARGARALRDLVESKGPLTGARMGRAQGHVAQVLRRPAPAGTVNM